MEETQSIIKDLKPSPIEEPPLKNKHSCISRALSALFTIIILGIISFIILSLFFSGPAIKRLAELPKNFPSDIPLFNFGDRSAIHFESSKKDDKIFNRLAQLPKYLLGPAILKFNPALSEDEKTLLNGVKISESPNFEDIKKLIRPSEEENVDIITIDWENLNETAKKISIFYKKNLVNQDYQVAEEKTYDGLILKFNKDKIKGEIEIKSSNEKQTDLTLKVKFQSP